eukprot:scaffold175231_cov50-Prasinocladus_malaysianus.AAC.1
MAPRAMQRTRRKKDDDPSVSVWQERADAKKEATRNEAGLQAASLRPGLLGHVQDRLRMAVKGTVDTWAVYFRQRT